MRRAIATLTLAATLALAAGCQTDGRNTAAGPSTQWEGTWALTDAEAAGRLRAEVQPYEDGRYVAKFTGFRDDATIYRTTLTGFRRGDRVVFHDDVDLGEQLGGGCLWSCSMAGDQMVGYLTREGRSSGRLALHRQ